MNAKRSTKFSGWLATRKLYPAEKSDRRKLRATERRRSIVVGATERSSLHTIIALCLIALLLILNAILRFPDLGSIIAQYNQF